MTAKLDTSILFIQVANLEARARPHAWHPSTDLFESESGYTVQVEIAGMKDEDFSIQYNRNRLVISGADNSQTQMRLSPHGDLR